MKVDYEYITTESQEEALAPLVIFAKRLGYKNVVIEGSGFYASTAAGQTNAQKLPLMKKKIIVLFDRGLVQIRVEIETPKKPSMKSGVLEAYLQGLVQLFEAVGAGMDMKEAVGRHKGAQKIVVKNTPYLSTSEKWILGIVFLILILIAICIVASH